MEGANHSISETIRVTITVLTDNYYDALRPDTPFATRYRTSPGKSIYSEHGLSYFIETVSNGKTGACMFDFGMNPDIVAPMHCTGFEALVAFSSAMPDAFILNTAGTRYTFKT